MIKTILFDFYGVFLPDAYDRWLQKNSLQREGIFADIIKQSNQGSMSEAEFLSALSSATGRSVLASEIHSAILTPDTELIKLVHELKTNYTIGLLSNASVRLRGKLENFGINTLFDTIVISSEIGHAKPSSEAYEIAIEKLKTPASDIVFIDDNQTNVEAALQSGMQSFIYTGVATLRKDLKSLQIL